MEGGEKGGKEIEQTMESERDIKRMVRWTTRRRGDYNRINKCTRICKSVNEELTYNYIL